MSEDASFFRFRRHSRARRRNQSGPRRVQSPPGSRSRGKEKQEERIDRFELTPTEWVAWNRERYGDDRLKWRPPVKILRVCGRLLTGFYTPIE